jgi:EAL domain-containing protein (putative c-di-GMP-specific phosphodiesterase class I)
VHASIGYAVADADLPTPSSDQLMADADIAMYQAKRRGKNEICGFRPGMAHEAAPDQHLVPALAQAVKSGAIRVVYQPIVDLRSGEIAGFEALARWRCEGRDVPPTVFIPLAEKHELISTLTDHVLETACRQLSVWNERTGDRGLNVAVNIPAALLADLGFPARVAAVLARHRLSERGQLTLEVTETSLVSSPDLARHVCAQLTAIGVCLSLDDFGTGYSSLTQLQAIPLDILKIDRSFVTKVCLDTSSQRLLKAIVQMAHTLGLRVVAEGVETAEQVSVLREYGCEYAQGFLFGAPQEADTAPLARRAVTPNRR